MTHTDYFRRPTGQTLYAKPLPLVVTPWSADVLVATENATTGSYAFSGLADDSDYEIFVQAGGSPVDSDPAVGAFARPVDTSGIDVLLDRVKVLTGPNVVDVSVLDLASDPIEQAKVRLSKLGDTESQLTDAAGLTQFSCENGEWTVAVSAAGYISELHNIAISSDTQLAYTLTAIPVVTPPAAPELCVVQIFARHNGALIENALCKARLRSINSAIDGTVLSTQIDESVTDSLGYAELQLVRASEFVDGDGQYVIDIWHGERRIVSVTVTIPDQESVNLEDLIVS